MNFTEKVNPKKCQFLLTMKKGEFETLFPKSDDDEEKSTNNCSFYSTLSYCKKQKKAKFALKVDYKRSVLNPISGRLYAKGPSLQNLRSEVRKFLTQDIYKDYDMSNAHPCFLLEKSKLLPEEISRRLPCEMLCEYCANREQFFEETGVNKKFMLRLFNKDRTDYLVRNHCSKLKDFARHLQTVKKALFDHFYPIHRDKYHFDRSGKNPMSGFLWALITGGSEDAVLQEALQRLDHAKIGCLMFDGFLYEDTIDQTFFEILKRESGPKCGHVNWKEKPNESDVLMPDVVAEYTYENVKETFEEKDGLYACKIMNPPCFVVMMGEDRVFFKKQDFITAYESVNYEVIQNGEIVEETFLKKWFRDSSIQNKDKLGMFPNEEDCPDHIYNVWEPFEVLNWDKSQLAEPGSCSCGSAVDMFLNHLSVLTNYEQNTYNFLLRWTAHIFQKPHIKPGVCVVLLGEQGIGKDMFLDTLAAIMGHKKRYESTSPEKEVYGNFNPLLLNALVVQLSEIDKSNTLGHIGHLKSLITAPTITIYDKHKSPLVIPSLHRYVIVTNNEDPVTQESGQRRFVSAYGSSAMKGNDKYFNEYVHNILDNKNALNSIYNYLMTVEDVPDVFVNIDRHFSKFQSVMAQQNIAYHVGFLQYMVKMKVATDSLTNDVSQAEIYTGEELYCHFRQYIHENGGRSEGYTLRKLKNRLAAISVNNSIEIIDNGSKFKFLYKSPGNRGLIYEFGERQS